MNATLASRVLVVDDDPGVLTLLCRAVESMGHDVEWAASRAQARERLRDRAFDAVVADVAMESADAGVRLAEEIETMAPGLPVILFSGAPRSRELIASSAAKPSEYLAKPFHLNELTAAITRALSQRTGGAGAPAAPEARAAQLGALLRTEAWSASERGQNVTFSIWGKPRSILVNPEQLSRAIAQMIAGVAFLVGRERRVHATLEYQETEAILTVGGDGRQEGLSWEDEPRLSTARAIFESLGCSVRIVEGAFTVILPFGRR